MNWRRFFHREKADAEQRAELELYLDLTTQELIDRGMAPAAARAAARRKLGNPTQILEEVYRMNTLTFLESALRDARQALRMIRTRPGFSASVLLSLALGIGANTAIFSVVNGVLIRPLPYPEPASLIAVTSIFVVQGRRFDNAQLSPGMYGAYKENSQVFERFGVWLPGAATASGLGNPEQINTITVTQGVLPTLGVPPALGRWFSLEDDTPGTPETVILSHGYWQRKFGGAPDILNRTLTIDFIPRQIIGVMPPDFRFLDRSPEVFLPQRFPATGLKADSFGFNGIARLKPGATLAAANQDTNRILIAWAESERLTKMLKEMDVQPNLHPLKDDVVGDIGTALAVVMVALGLVLLLVCANVANLVIVRAESRRQEFSIRAALGAGWGRIARELLVESLTLGALGGALGLLLAYLGLQLLVKLGPGTLPRLQEISLDAPAVAYVLVCSLVLSLLFGLAAVLKLGHPGRLRNARGATQSAGQRRAQSGLVIVQVALALVLLVASGLMIRTFLALQAVQPGFTHPEQIQTVRLSIPEALVPDPHQVIRQQADLVEKLAASPPAFSPPRAPAWSPAATSPGMTSLANAPWPPSPRTWPARPGVGPPPLSASGSASAASAPGKKSSESSKMFTWTEWTAPPPPWSISA
ncbi:MAG: ABC transporter permease [Acidobacteria bacterium]|nr:ABC transporter permease [Acidobacteriota bacterium]